MLSKSECVQRIIECGVMAAARLPSAGTALDAAAALLHGGVSVIEFSMTMPGALEAIQSVTAHMGGQVLVGVGTVLDPETARAAILSGAQFVVSATISPAVVEMAHRYGRPAIPGALSPTEVLTAYECGAELVKVFPAGNLGPDYVRAVLAPLCQVSLMVDGGVTLHNAKDFVKAGAVALGVGRHLVDFRAVESGDYGRLTELARGFVRAVNEARAELGSAN